MKKALLLLILSFRDMNHSRAPTVRNLHYQRCGGVYVTVAEQQYAKQIYIPDLCRFFLPELYSSPLTPNVISWCLSRGKPTRSWVRAVMSTSCHISVASGRIMCLPAHIFIYFPSSRAMSGRQMSCSQGKKIICGEKRGRGGVVVGRRERGGGGKYMNMQIFVTVWNLVMSGETLSPSFIMQRSLFNASHLGPASSLCCNVPTTPPQPPPVISQQLEPNYSLA